MVCTMSLCDGSLQLPIDRIAASMIFVVKMGTLHSLDYYSWGLSGMVLYLGYVYFARVLHSRCGHFWLT